MAGRRAFLALSALAAVAAIGLVWPRLFHQELPRESLRLGIADVVNTFPVLIAEEKGFFRNEGLDVAVRHFPNGKPALEAQLRGELEVVTVAETPAVIKSFSHRDFVILASFCRTDQDGKVIAHPGSGIAAFTDLRGKRVGTVAGTTAHFVLHALLADHGMEPGEIDEVPLRPQEIQPALSERRVDAVAVFEPYASLTQAALDNAGTVFTGGGRTRIAFLYTSSRNFPVQRPQAAKRLLTATDKAIDWIRGHRQEAVTIVSRRTGLDPKVVDSLWDGYRAQLSLDQTLLVSLEDQARWAVKTGQVARVPIPNYLDFINPSPLAAVKPEMVMSIR